MGTETPDTPLLDAARERAKTIAEKNAAPKETIAFSDRCDQCGSQAFAQAFMANASSLFFCRHHFLQHHAALELKAESMVDETDRVNVRRDTA